MPSPNLARSARKLEDLPSDGGAAVDCLAGGLLRTFIRLNELEARSAAPLVADGAAPAKAGNGATTDHRYKTTGSLAKHY